MTGLPFQAKIVKRHGVEHHFPGHGIVRFSKPYSTIDTPIFFSNDIPGISGPESLTGFVVAVVSRDSAIDVLRSRGVTTIKEYPSYEDIISDAKNGKIYVFCMDQPAAMYFLYRYGIVGQFKATQPIYSQNVHWAVRKGDPLLITVQQGFDQINKEEYQGIERRWLGEPVISREESERLFWCGVIIALAALVGLALIALWNRILQKTVERRTVDLTQKTNELQVAYEQLTATAEELKHNYDELHRIQQALTHARKKLNLLNSVTFQDIQEALFSLAGYLELQRELPMDEKAGAYVNKEKEVAEKISNTLAFAKNYQDMGMSPPLWQNTNQVFLLAISHLDISGLSRKVNLDNLELYADPLLETVFFNLAENLMRHGKTATEISLCYRETTDRLTVFIEDNGAGIPDADKEKIFERGYGAQKGMGLFLVREILGITNISINETGTYGKGARFEIMVPKGAYRFTDGI